MEKIRVFSMNYLSSKSRPRFDSVRSNFEAPDLFRLRHEHICNVFRRFLSRENNDYIKKGRIIMLLQNS